MKKSPLLLLFLAVCFTPLLAQQSVSGLVTSSDDGQPLIGVTVTVKGTTTGTVSDLDGRYSIDVASDGILVFSYTGFAVQEITVGSQTTIDVILDPGVALGEVVVTALGVERDKKALSYSVTEVPEKASKKHAKLT